MKCILVTRFYPPDTGGGGIAAYARYAATGLAAAGHEVRVISAMAENSQPRQTLEGVDVFRIPSPFSSSRWMRIPFLGRRMRLMRDVLYAWRVRQLLFKMRPEFCPDLVEYADIDAEAIFHPRQLCPYVVKLHTPQAVLRDYDDQKTVSFQQRGIEWLEAHAIQRATGVSSPSKHLARRIETMLHIPQGGIQYVPNFINTDIFSPRPAACEPFTVLYVGRLDERKGVVVFAQAIPHIARAFPQARFIFLGADRPTSNGTSQQAALRQFFEQEQLTERVEFHGHASPEVFLSFYQRAALFVLPSLFENCPYTLLEAMSCGLPCVVSRSGGMPEMLVDGVSGVLFEPGNAVDLAEKVTGLLQSPAQAQSIGAAAREHVLREYSLSVGIEKTLAFYKAVAA